VSSAGSGDMMTIYRHLSPATRRRFGAVCMLMPATAAAEMLMVAAIVPFLAIIGEAGSQGGLLGGMPAWLGRILPLGGLAAAAMLFIIAALVAAALRLSLSWTSLRFSAEMGHELTMAIQRRLLHQPYLFHVSTHSSRLLASLEKVDELALYVSLNAIQGLSAVIIALAVVAALMLVDLLSAVSAVLLIAGLYGAAILSVRRKFRTHSAFLVTARDRRMKIVQENIGGIRDIIIDRSQEAHLTMLDEVDRRFLRTLAELGFLSAAPRYLVEGIGLGIVAIAALFIAGRPGGLPAALPVLGALALGAQRLFPLANQIYGGWVAYATSKPILKECAALLNLPISKGAAEPASLPFNRSIAFELVSFRYPGQARPALHRISFAIPHQSRVAIVGKSGSGKSTLVDLLMGLIEPSEGQIWIDGALLSGGSLAQWRQSVAHVPQAPFLADTSIANNIALGGRALDMARIKQAAKAAHLHGFIRTLPDGYDSMVGERGVKLSGGQRQRLALARAIYREAPLMVLDEATSALDEDTEAAILASLDELHAEGRTIVIIAHRLSTIQRCDQIFMLDDGELVQSGSFAELFGPLTRLHEEGEL